MSKKTSTGGTAKPPRSNETKGVVTGAMPSFVKTPPPPKIKNK